VVLVYRHARNEPEAPEGVDDAIDRGVGDRHDESSLGAKKTAAGGDRVGLLVIVKMLEDREHRDRLKAIVGLEIARKVAAHEANAIALRAGGEIRIDADATGDSRSENPEERAVGATHVEDARAGRDVRRGLRDAPALQNAIESLHLDAVGRVPTDSLAAVSEGVSVVLPCLNEVENVAAVVREAKDAMNTAGLAGEVIVVDNGSTDGSDAAAASAGARVVLERRRGYGAAYMAGFAAAEGDVIVMADADGSYDFSALPLLIDRIRDGDDLVMGSRFKGTIEPGAMPWTHQHIGSPILSGLLNLLYRTGIEDAHCGMRAFRRSALPDMRLRMPGMEFASEMVVNAARAGLRIGEVPVNYRVRGGRSKLRTVPDGWRHLRFLMLYSPTHLFLVPGLTLLAIGLVMLVALLPGPVILLGRLFDIHVMVLGALLTLIGFQVLAIGLYAKTLAVTLRLQPMDRTLRTLRAIFSLERGLAAGGLLFILGFIVDFAIAAEWASSGFGPLNAVRPALFALVTMLLGIQIVFSSLFLFTIELQVREPTPLPTRN
jgi:glycosyltransferase involved in cell wall biosynthesis